MCVMVLLTVQVAGMRGIVAMFAGMQTILIYYPMKPALSLVSGLTVLVPCFIINVYQEAASLHPKSVTPMLTVVMALMKCHHFAQYTLLSLA